MASICGGLGDAHVQKTNVESVNIIHLYHIKNISLLKLLHPSECRGYLSQMICMLCIIRSQNCIMWTFDLGLLGMGVLNINSTACGDILNRVFPTVWKQFGSSLKEALSCLT